MPRMKFGLILVGLVAMLAASATPALALFEGKELSGVVLKENITKGGEFVYEGSKPAVAVKCPPKSVEIAWSLPALKSSEQTYKIKWGSECGIQVGTERISATISESELLAKSPESGKASYTELKGSNLKETIIKTALCEIKVPVEGNKELGNTEQKSPSLTSFEETIGVNVKGITSSQKAIGVGCGLASKSTTGELKGVEFKLTGQGQR